MTLCLCGCGERTTIARRNDPRDNVVKGEPMRFVRGHHARLRGFSAEVKNGNEQARRMYPDPLGQCEDCASCEAVDRHHKNGDSQDNRRENIAFLCRRCHMLADGRLAAFAVCKSGRPSDAPRDWHGRYAKVND